MGMIANLSTRAKLLLGFGLMIALMATVSIKSYRDNVALVASQHELFEDDLSIAIGMVELRNAINRERVALLSLLVVDPSGQAAATRQLEAEMDAIGAVLVTLRAAR